MPIKNRRVRAVLICAATVTLTVVGVALAAPARAAGLHAQRPPLTRSGARLHTPDPSVLHVPRGRDRSPSGQRYLLFQAGIGNRVNVAIWAYPMQPDGVTMASAHHTSCSRERTRPGGCDREPQAGRPRARMSVPHHVYSARRRRLPGGPCDLSICDDCEHRAVRAGWRECDRGRRRHRLHGLARPARCCSPGSEVRLHGDLRWGRHWPR